METIESLFGPIEPAAKAQAEAYINGLATNPVLFCETLIGIMGKNSPHATGKVAVSIFLKSFLNSKLTTRALDAQTRAEIFKPLLLAVMTKDGLDQQVISHAMPSIENLLFFDEADSMGSLSSEVFRPIMEGLGQTDPEVLKATMLVLRSAFTVLTDEKKMAERFGEVSGLLIQACIKL